MYPPIRGKIMHNGLTILSYLYPIKNLKPLCLNLSDITILFMSTKFKAIACLEAWNSFLLTTIHQILTYVHSFLYYKNKFAFFFVSLYLFLPYSFVASFSSSVKFLYFFFAFSFVASLFA